MTTFVLDISNTIPRISHSVMHKQSWLLLLLGPSVHHKSVHQSITNQIKKFILLKTLHSQWILPSSVTLVAKHSKLSSQ